MVDPVILSLDREEVARLDKAARAGDSSAVEWFAHLFDDYREQHYQGIQPVVCFLDDNPIEDWPPHATLLGDVRDPSRVVAVALCARCTALPRAVRFSRVMRMWRHIEKARSGRDIHFQMTPLHQRHGRGRRR